MIKFAEDMQFATVAFIDTLEPTVGDLVVRKVLDIASALHFDCSQALQLIEAIERIKESVV